MKESITNFIFGTAGTFGTTLGTGVVDPEQIGSIEDIIRYIISILGGILAAIIIRILKNKFPELFNKKK